MELNREQIIKALECCASEKYIREQCPIDEKTKDDCECGKVVARNALALIKELTQKLKIANLKIDCKERICESYMLQYGTVADKEVFLKKERADTVRKMQERLKEHLEKPEFPWDNFTVAEKVIDQIAKEMKGENK